MSQKQAAPSSAGSIISTVLGLAPYSPALGPDHLSAPSHVLVTMGNTCVPGMIQAQNKFS